VNPILLPSVDIVELFLSMLYTYFYISYSLSKYRFIKGWNINLLLFKACLNVELYIILRCSRHHVTINSSFNIFGCSSSSSNWWSTVTYWKLWADSKYTVILSPHSRRTVFINYTNFQPFEFPWTSLIKQTQT
jgi:hypothetical protein